MTKAGRLKAKGSRRDPQFRFFIDTIRQPVTPQHPAWSRPLPLSRLAFSETSSPHLQPDESISVGDYFSTVRSFLHGVGREAILAALERQGAAETAPQIVRVFLAKHGEYYHPARVETESGGALLHWVVNVAVSSAGKSLLQKEYAILKRLNREFALSYLPEVYAASEADAGHGRSIALFLGEWLSGFHEFHLAQDAPDSKQTLVLWDPEKGRLRMDSVQAAAIYHQVARILTHYINLSTFEGIAAWHHAAGDFVVKVSASRIEVRLITVRDYRPLFSHGSRAGGGVPDIKTLLEALLIFLLDLSIRTRLDRLDGTGDMAWSDPLAVEATVAGVLLALSEKPDPFELPLPLHHLFRQYLAACSTDDLQELCFGIASKYGSEAPVVKERLKEHVSVLAHALGRV